MVTEEELKIFKQELDKAEMSATSERIKSLQQDIIEKAQDKGMIKEQLDLQEELAMIENLLRGRYIKRDPETQESKWEEPEKEDRLFTEYGINLILGFVQWYLNKNTLLSNYEEKEIYAKMEDLANTINDRVFMEYDRVFLYPTLEECKDEIKKRIEKRINLRMFANELLNKEIDKELIKKDILKEMEGRIEREFYVIKEQKIKNKLKAFESIIRTIQDSIHSSYNRAWKGQERKTLRQHYHITETKGEIMPMQRLGFFDKLRGKSR